MNLERIGILGGLILALLAVNAMVVEKEVTLREGEVVLLALAPVDPRSLMQGDYMALDYGLKAPAPSADPDADFRPQRLSPEEDWPPDGHLVVHLQDGVGLFVRRDEGTPLGRDELRLRYRIRNSRLQVGTDAFYFEEGTAETYEKARYGELRVDKGGDSVLVGLRDENKERLGVALE